METIQVFLHFSLQKDFFFLTTILTMRLPNFTC